MYVGSNYVSKKLNRDPTNPEYESKVNTNTVSITVYQADNVHNSFMYFILQKYTQLFDHIFCIIFPNNLLKSLHLDHGMFLKCFVPACIHQYSPPPPKKNIFK